MHKKYFDGEFAHAQVVNKSGTKTQFPFMNRSVSLSQSAAHNLMGDRTGQIMRCTGRQSFRDRDTDRYQKQRMQLPLISRLREK